MCDWKTGRPPASTCSVDAGDAADEPGVQLVLGAGVGVQRHQDADVLATSLAKAARPSPPETAP